MLRKFYNERTKTKKLYGMNEAIFLEHYKKEKETKDKKREKITFFNQ